MSKNYFQVKFLYLLLYFQMKLRIPNVGKKIFSRKVDTQNKFINCDFVDPGLLSYLDY